MTAVEDPAFIALTPHTNSIHCRAMDTLPAKTEEGRGGFKAERRNHATERSAGRWVHRLSGPQPKRTDPDRTDPPAAAHSSFMIPRLLLSGCPAACSAIRRTQGSRWDDLLTVRDMQRLRFRHAARSPPILCVSLARRKERASCSVYCRVMDCSAYGGGLCGMSNCHYTAQSINGARQC